ncbi:uncharacterized protein LOC131009383 [Salvia miltiorrhiza]|uniref:uncharacterized protein LOC131009383 n=1 Tax=Salvia miltiorrhiza TaxID=226208 RepID=UPI0025AB8F2C|nr:uncharacterized protein LOC131009383 [Salvia miltiorrhiza]
MSRMSDHSKDAAAAVSLAVVMNEERNKVLFAVADNHFADILISFLTLPLGRILKLLEKHYGKEAPAIGSLSSFYRGVANLGASHFATEGAKQALLNPRSSFEAKCERLKFDVTDPPPAEYFRCSNNNHKKYRSVSLYYDTLGNVQCSTCCYGSVSKKVVESSVLKKVVEKSSVFTPSSCGVFTKQEGSFIICDDLQIFPNDTGISGIVSFLGIRDSDCKGEAIRMELGFNEVMNLLLASLTSPTPLSDIILKKTRNTISAMPESKPKIPLHDDASEEENPNSKNLSLKLTIQKSTGKLLHAEAKKEFVEFLFSLLFIPLGGVGNLLRGNTSFKAIDNLYRSTANGEIFDTGDIKERLTKFHLVHGCISESHILPISEENLPSYYKDFKSSFSSVNFRNGKGSYLKQRKTYKVTDDLTVVPYCLVSILCSLGEQKIPITDVEEVELQIGLKEGLSILQASLTSTSALSDALLGQISNKRPLTSTSAVSDALPSQTLNKRLKTEDKTEV